jgi:hypothetical protein
MVVSDTTPVEMHAAVTGAAGPNAPGPLAGTATVPFQLPSAFTGARNATSSVVAVTAT